MNPKQLSKQQVDTILKNAPMGVDKKKLLDKFIMDGYDLEGVDSNAIRQDLQAKIQPQEPSFLEGLKTDLNQRVDKVGAIQNRTDTSLLEKGVQTFGQGAGLAANAIEKTAEQIPGAKQVFGAFGAGIKWLSESALVKGAVSGEDGLGISKGDNKWLQEATQLYDTDPNFRDTVDGVANIARLTGDVQMIADAVNLVKNTTTKLTSVVKSKLPPDGGAGALSATSDNVLKAGTELKNNIQLSIAKKNVSPQLESSANRLFLDGTKNLESPLTTYDKYLSQSKKAIGDIKADPAISVVGEKMGNAFETVVKQRSAVGKVLGEELKANGGIKVNVVEPRTNLLSELKDSGLSYNPKTNKLTSFQGSKFAPEEVKMLNDFVKGVNKLGDNPSVSMIDNFIAKTRATLQFTKGESGVIGTTNAERIINGQISRLRATLDPAINGNKVLSKYWQANKTYSELSDFVDEGSTFLGKKTLSGDFAKDASVAKSSVQSILNQGKKDFMIKLEALTGYKAIDDAVLALQAMKDAGDFRGLSLLQAMSETGIPTSTAGVTRKILDYALSKGGEFIAGTPEQQTRALLQSLENNIKKPVITKPTSNTKPTTGAKINKSSQPKSSGTVIKNSVSQTKPKVNGLKVKGEIPTTNAETSLMNEAKKYKSAEEFVKAQTNAYHGTAVDFKTFSKDFIGDNQPADFGQGFYFAKDKASALGYAKEAGGNKVMDVNLNIKNPAKNKDLLAPDVQSAIDDGMGFKDVGDVLKAKGFDGIEYTRADGTVEYTVFDANKIKTKSQLTDIWNKANKK